MVCNVWTQMHLMQRADGGAVPCLHMSGIIRDDGNERRTGGRRASLVSLMQSQKKAPIFFNAGH
jgi:hypothetical protein